MAKTIKPDELGKTIAEQLGIYEFERCIYDPDTRRMTASVTTTFYRKGA